MFHMKKTAIAAIVAATAGLGAVGVAQAESMAFASNQLTNFSITTTAGFSPVGISSRNTITSAQFNNMSSGFQAPTTLGNPSDAQQATAGPGPFPGPNTFTPFPTLIGSRGDAFTAAGSPFMAGGVPNVNNVAEGRLLTNSFASATSAGRNTAEASVLVTTPGTFTFSFTDTFRVSASTDFSGESANASITNIFSIANDAGMVIFSFAPNGVLNAAQGETADPFNLQAVCGSNSGVPAGQCLFSGSGFFSATSPTLANGEYTISLRTASQINLVTPQAVPEPTSLLLVGAGILGLGIVRRRKSA